MLVADLMRRTVYSCSVTATLNDAARIMWEHRVGCVPVLADGGHVVGIVTDRDVCMGAYTSGARLAAIAVTASMSRKVVCCRPTQTLRDVEELMRSHQIRRLPVVDDPGRLLGLVSLDDIARHMRPSWDGAGGLGADAIALTLASVAERA